MCWTVALRSGSDDQTAPGHGEEGRPSHPQRRGPEIWPPAGRWGVTSSLPSSSGDGALVSSTTRLEQSPGAQVAAAVGQLAS